MTIGLKAGLIIRPVSPGQLISVDTSETGSSLVVAVSGELDIASVPDLAEAVESFAWDRYDRVVFDLLDTNFIDSSGLGALIALRNKHPETDMALVTGDEGLVAKVLELTSMKDLFPIYSSTNEALA